MRSVTASPGFVPHEAWDQFMWLLPHAQRKEPWYYAAFRNQPPGTRKLPADPAFMRTVDPVLRPIVSQLHSRGIPTGPSCSGHRVSKREFKDIYTGLEEDRDQIIGEGLVLRDPETSLDYVMHDDSYELPWKSFSEFQKAATEHQPVGWLSFYTTDPRMPLALGTGPGFEIKKTAPDAYGIRTTGENPEAWRLASEVLRRVL